MSGACGCWHWLPAKFLRHIVELTSRWCWRSGHFCGVRGLLISRSVAGCWRDVWLCSFGIWYLRLSPNLYWPRCPGIRTCRLLWCLLGVVVLGLAVCCLLSWPLSSQCWFVGQSSQHLPQHGIASLDLVLPVGEKAGVDRKVQVLQLLREGPLDARPPPAVDCLMTQSTTIRKIYWQKALYNHTCFL